MVYSVSPPPPDLAIDHLTLLSKLTFTKCYG